ncbi:DUF1080 domain-containing protein [candidate division KSB1 bacterium]|nr:DUF1080 domain-containing protein [candidate division KSB1 bacterium]
MKRFSLIPILLFVVVLWMGCSTSSDAEKVMLFNGTDFNGWTFVLADTTVQPEDVWSVQDGVIHCKGVPNGYMRTMASYSDYQLHVEWRWTENPTNSGVLLHVQFLDQIWPNAFECQLQAESAGDFVLIGPGSVTVNDSTYSIMDKWLVIPKQHESSEKPAGEWNTYEITVKGSTITATVNGVIQNHGTDVALSSGSIALQSEGSPIEFRNVWVK